MQACCSPVSDSELVSDVVTGCGNIKFGGEGRLRLIACEVPSGDFEEKKSGLSLLGLGQLCLVDTYEGC